MSLAISLSGVTKTFGSTVAVDSLDLAVPVGALYGFIGPNGAGKTTTLRMIMSILFPDRGELSVLGRPGSIEAKDRIGYLPEERGVYRKMKVGAFLVYMARLKGVKDFSPERAAAWLERLNLAGVQDKKCEELSKGMLQKVQLIAAVLHAPELLILDEPFSGLDPVNMRLLRELILAEHRRGATIIFSTHVMVHAEEICDHIVMLHQGRKVLDEDLVSVQRRHDPRALIFEPFERGADASALAALDGVDKITRDGGTYRIDLREGADPVRAMRAVAAAVPPVTSRSPSPIPRGHLHRAGHMSKIFLIARRDFLATVSTKGFIIAIMVPPLIYTAIITVFPRLMNNRVPAVSGGLVVIDHTGQVTPGVRRYLEPQAMAARREAAFNRAMESTPMGGAESSGAGGAVAQRAVMGESTTIDITESPAGALELEKQQLTRDDGMSAARGAGRSPACCCAECRGQIGRLRFVRPAEPRHPHSKRDSQWRGRRHRRRPRARRGPGSATDRRADHCRAAGVDHRDRERRIGDETGFRAAAADGVRAVADDFGHEQRPVPVDDDDRREVEPDDGGDSVGGVAVRAADGKNPWPDGGRPHDSRHVLPRSAFSAWFRWRCWI